jgi:hypothetical protein
VEMQVPERRQEEEPAAYQARRVRARVLIHNSNHIVARLISEDAFLGAGCSGAADLALRESRTDCTERSQLLWDVHCL